MIKTYNEFIAVCKDKRNLYDQIPVGHLSQEGMGVYNLYKAVIFLSAFTSDATELLQMLHDDEDVAEAAKFAGFEYGLIANCLGRLASKESLATAEEAKK